MFALRASVETSCSNCEAAEFIGTCLEYLREFRHFFKENLGNSSSYSGSGIRKIAEVKNPNKFSIIADRNPDIILVDQLDMSKKRGLFVQGFCFVPSISHSSEHEDKIT